MYIKKIIIEGFKTYRSRTEYSDFSPKVNAILGLNGSGKSSVYDAIQFVLSDKYANLHLDARVALLSSGAGGRATVATVEIIFDNSDGRLPVERKGTVSLKRVMSQKKDEYFLDNKSVTRSDIANLLEGAGMTKSNPYYFVQQGRIQELVKMSSADRLRLLMNVAGTTTYEERRAESLRIMESTDAQMEEVEAIMATIDLRIKDLEKEKVVLDKYNALTAERDSLMHLKYTRALEEAEDKLASLAATAVDVKAWKERSEATQARIAAESEKARVSDALGVAELELAKVQRDITKLTALEEDAKGSVARAKEVVADDQRLMEAAEAELGKVVALVEETEAALRQAEADLVRTTAEEVEAEKTLVEAERERSVAEAKVGVDGQMFDTEKARLAFIHDRIKAMEAELAANTARLKDAETAKADAAKELKEALKAAEVEVGREARVKAEAEHQADKLAACEAELTTLSSRRRDIWAASSSSTRTEADARASLTRTRHALDRVTGSGQSRGVEGVLDLCQELRIPGVYGPLGGLIACKDIFAPCLESVARARLGHIVCDNDATAARVLGEIVRRGLPRVTLLPANRVVVRDITVDKKDGILLSKHAEPNVDAIWSTTNTSTSNALAPSQSQSQSQSQSDADAAAYADVSRVLQSVFGQTVVVRDLESGAAVASRLRIDCITSACDAISRDGVYEGGYRAKGAALLSAWREYTSALTEVRGGDVAKRRAEQAVAELGQSEMVLREQRETLRAALVAASNAAQEAEAAVGTARDAARAAERNSSACRARAEAAAAAVDASAAALEATKAAVKSKAGPSAAELKHAKGVVERAAEAKAALLKARDARTVAQSAVSELSLRLRESLRPRRERVRHAMAANATHSMTAASALSMSLSRAGAGAGGDVEDADVAEAEAALELIHDQLTTATSSLKQLQKELTALQKQLTTATSTLTSASSREAAAIAAAAALERGAVTESGARATWARRRAAVLDHLRALGPVTPVPASTRASLSGAALERRVAEAAVGVGALGGVNRQCGAQLACAEEELRGLRARADELSQGRVAIESLVRELDARKEEAVDRSVKTVAAHFSRAVEELLPGARATLVLHTSGDQQDHDQQQQPDDDDDEKQKKSRSSSKSSKTSKSKKTISSSSSSPGIPGTVSGVGSLTGVGMQVSFAGQAHAAGRLSGGQKTMLALALVVALQRADPSPVYLLDEVDANLDSGHRTAVAALVKGMGEEAQVVCTTFRGELLGACEKAYMVRFEDRESKVEAVGMREARAFMQGGAR